MDVWATGISAIEMAEAQPPRWKVHPMRVIFLIGREPPPQLADKDHWSLPFHDFVGQCLQKVAACTSRVLGFQCCGNAGLRRPTGPSLSTTLWLGACRRCVMLSNQVLHALDVSLWAPQQPA